MTEIINLFGGGGSGKSTNAALIFGELKMRGILAEQVTEYVKEWAWDDRVPNEFDQLYIFAKQARKEYMLFNKVDFIVTDSPVLLSGFYEEKYYKYHITKPAIDAYIKAREELGVKHHNFFMRRTKPYVKAGRYQTEEEARQIDVEMRDWLTRSGQEFTEVDGYNDILEILGIK